MRSLPLKTGLGARPDEAKGHSEETAPQRDLEADLRRVVHGQAVPAFCFQPIADLRRAVVAGYEALVRLPVRGNHPPDVCLAAAANLGIHLEVEAIITEQVMQARGALPGNVFLSLNVSPAFLCSPLWDRTGLAASDLAGLVIEITEGEFIEDYQRVRGRVAEVRERGGIVAIDDAGAGYASLKHILELKPSSIKLDRNFVHNCATDRAKAAMIEALGAAADRLDAWVITEGVETAAELVELVHLGVPLAQGYFLGRPETTMRDLTPEAREVLASYSGRGETTENLLLFAEACPSATTRERAERLLSEDVHLAAVTDDWGRPIVLLERAAVCEVKVMPGPLRCHLACEVRDVLQRALTRPSPNRFEPILLTDSEGRLQGAVRVDRLMQAVLGGASGANKKLH